MVVSENVLKWALRFYPPLFFQRIWVIRFKKGFTGVRVKLNKSLFNKNYNNSIFGGTIYAAADPFYPVLFHQLLAHKGYNVVVWMKAAGIQFLKPGRKDLFFDINISAADVEEIEETLKKGEKHVRPYPITMYDKDGELCVEVSCEIYIRNRAFDEAGNDILT